MKLKFIFCFIATTTNGRTAISRSTTYDVAASVYVDFFRRNFFFVLTSSMFIKTKFGLFCPVTVELKMNTLIRIIFTGIVNSMIF